jgi:hypothetical protein
MNTPFQGAEITEQVKFAAEAYVYGYPLVYNMQEIAKFPIGTSLLGKSVPYNTFGCAQELLDPGAKFVSPNNDTLYLIAICDVRREPLVLKVPDTHDRYYVLQLVDAWSNNFAYIGRRATGTVEQVFVLVHGDPVSNTFDGMRVVHAPTGIFAIVGRVAVNGKDDLPKVHSLQDQFGLTSLSEYQGEAVSTPPEGVPQPDPRVGEELKWWEEFRVALAAFPPPSADAPFLAICKELGLLEAESPYLHPEPTLAKILVAGQNAAVNKIEELIKSSVKPVNGWQDAKHLFDYNADFFEIGTQNTSTWIIPDRKIAYVTRAVAARAGLWGNHGYEANYQIVYVDADNNPLTSDNRYELHLPTPPPVDAFWSLTMYNVPEFYLVENPINRYSIGDRTPGLMYGADGSVTIYLQKDSPGADKESNWLPTPQSGAFRPILRMYQPKTPILDGSYVLPAIRRIG